MQTESEDGDNEQDDDYFTVEPVDIDEEEEDQTNCEMNPDVTGAASYTNEDLPDGLDEPPKESGPGDTSSLHPRDHDQNSQKQKIPDEEEEVMDLEDSDDNQSIMCVVMSKKSKICLPQAIHVLQQAV